VGGSGKTLLADIVSIMATGVTAPAMQYAATDEEAHKTALAVLAEGDPVVLIDNIERPLQGDWLCTALTSEIFRGRILGRTETVSVPTTTLWLATGNQLVIKGDLTLRAVLCRLDPKTERPDQRPLDADELRRRVVDARPQLVAAALTIMRAFIAAKCKPSDSVPPWGRFERWSDLVRAPLVWLGCTDPCRSAQELTQEDPVRVEHLAVMRAWQKVYTTQAVTIRELLEALSEAKKEDEYQQELIAALQEVAADRSGHISAKKLGYWLRSRLDRQVEGLAICKKAQAHGGVSAWAVLPVHR
jgi:putative DNA primase/helicase